MNWVDIIIIVILIMTVFAGLKTGIIGAVLSMAGVIVGVVLAGRFYEPLAERLTFISDLSMAKIAAFVIILIVVMIIAGIAAAVLRRVLSAVMLGWVNRLGGAVFGLVFGAVLCGAVLTIWVKFAGTPASIEESALAGFLLDKFPMVLGLLPSEFDSVRDFFQK